MGVEHQPGLLLNQRRLAFRFPGGRKMSAVRRSCQTIALATGRPVARSHSTVVSRWLGDRWRTSRASTSAVHRLGHHRALPGALALASCSTQPGCGNAGGTPVPRRPACRHGQTGWRVNWSSPDPAPAVFLSLALGCHPASSPAHSFAAAHQRWLAASGRIALPSVFTASFPAESEE